MSQSEKFLKHFIVIRFFPYKDDDFAQDIFDLDFLSRQVLLAKNNCIKSLENQSNKNFEIVFLANEKYFTDKKFDFIFTELKNSTELPISFIKTTDKNFAKKELKAFIKAACNEYDYVIHSRTDLDDFIYKDAVADTQNKVKECDIVLSYGYCKGYVYFNGVMYPYFPPYNGGYKAVLQSMILKSSLANEISFIGPYSFDHTKIKAKMENFLAAKGITFSENMFQRNTSTSAYIWFRHDDTYSNNGNPLVEIPRYIKRVKRLTGKDITKKYLEEEFAFQYDAKSIK